MRPIARLTVATALLGGTLMMLPGCSSTPIPPPYTQAELQAQCESRGGRWHDDDPMRSFCEYDSRD